MIKLSAALTKHLAPNQATFQRLLTWPGDIFSEGCGRITKRIQIGDQTYFVKLHTGVGWLEIIKNLVLAKMPILGAKPEYRAIQRCHQYQIPTMTIAGFGQFGINPARQQSFLITEALSQTESLENISKQWVTSPPSWQTKQCLLRSLADVLRRFHAAGMNHRDCYLCHFRVDQTTLATEKLNGLLDLYVMDLHRCQIRHAVPFRWLAKDLGSLLFSARMLNLSTRDRLRFIRHYRPGQLRTILTDPIWQAAEKRCQRLTKKHG